MATCYFLVNHTKRQYTDLGKRYNLEVPPVFGGLNHEGIVDTQIVQYLFDSLFDKLTFESDGGEMSFIDEGYTEVDIKGMIVPEHDYNDDED